jgi:hypothetical protein
MSRRFLWLAGAVVAAIAIYTVGWFYAADRLVAEAQATFDRLSRGGNRASCENAEARGYPFRIGLFCSSVFVERRAEGFTADARAFRSAAQVYAPTRVIAELDAPARIDLPRFLPLHLRWQTLRASSRLAMPLPERLSVAAEGLSAEADTPGAGNTGLFDAQRAELHLRPAGPDLDLALRADALQAGPLLAEGKLPPVSGIADLKLIDGMGHIERRDFDLPGAEFEIRRIDLTVEGGGTLSATGPLSIGHDGLIDADLQVKASDAKALFGIAARAFPEIGSELLTLGAGLGALGPDQPLPLRIRDGVATLGFIELGRIPPL